MKTLKRLLSEVRGYSLVETMVTASLFAMLILAAGSAFNESQKSMTWNYFELSLQEELRRTLDTMSREIRESSPSTPVPIVTNTNSISFEIPTSVSKNAVTSWKQINYGLASNNTVTRTSGGQTTVIGNGVQALNFVYNPAVSPRTIRIQVTGVRSAGTTTLDRDVTMTLTNEVTLRNG